MKYKAVIFDLDGVICHTDKYHYIAWKELADKLDIYFDVEINNRLRGVSRMACMEILLEKYKKEPLSQELKVKYANEKNEIYRRLLHNMTNKDLSIEVKQTLDKVRVKGIKIAIGSSSKNARFILERIGLNGYFDEVCDGTNISYSKPNPEVFIKASELLGIPTSKCLVVEDAKAGIEAAIAGGMDSAAIGDAVKCNRATYNLANFSDLLNI